MRPLFMQKACLADTYKLPLNVILGHVSSCLKLKVTLYYFVSNTNTNIPITLNALYYVLQKPRSLLNKLHVLTERQDCLLPDFFIIKFLRHSRFNMTL